MSTQMSKWLSNTKECSKLEAMVAKLRGAPVKEGVVACDMEMAMPSLADLRRCEEP